MRIPERCSRIKQSKTVTYDAFRVDRELIEHEELRVRTTFSSTNFDDDVHGFFQIFSHASASSGRWMQKRSTQGFGARFGPDVHTSYSKHTSQIHRLSVVGAW